jgi:hypothetical protein
LNNEKYSRKTLSFQTLLLQDVIRSTKDKQLHELLIAHLETQTTTDQIDKKILFLSFSFPPIEIKLDRSNPNQQYI